MPDPTPRSPSLDRLAAIHAADEDPVTGEDVTEQRIKTERALAGLIADHPYISMSKAEILDALEYDHEKLREEAAELYPSHFGGKGDV